LLSNLGLTAQMQGRYTQAEAYLQESLAMARQIGRPQIISNTLYAYGNLYLHWQQIEAAQTTFREMLTTVSEGSQDLVALAQYGLARAAMAQGNIEEAWKFGKVSVTTLEVMGHRTAQEVRDWLNSIHDGVEGEE